MVKEIKTYMELAGNTRAQEKGQARHEHNTSKRQTTATLNEAIEFLRTGVELYNESDEDFRKHFVNNLSCYRYTIETLYKINIGILKNTDGTLTLNY